MQAIVISTEVAHNLGFSQINAILLGTAIRIAQSLGLHKIAPRDLTASNEQDRRRELIDVEVGKRIWCQMLIQDLFAIPFNDSHGTHLGPFTLTFAEFPPLRYTTTALFD